jgi:hypothetical protein
MAFLRSSWREAASPEQGCETDVGAQRVEQNMMLQMDDSVVI